MDITRGHIWFAAIFFAVFVIVIAIMYAKDAALHRRYYRHSWKVVLIVVGLFLLFFALKKILL